MICCIAVARHDSLTHQNAQIVGQRRLRTRRSIRSGTPCSAIPWRWRGRGPPRLGFEAFRRARPPRTAPRPTSATQQRRARADSFMAFTRPPAARASASALAFAGRGAPTRSRRSESDSAPPKNMNSAPSQISKTMRLEIEPHRHAAVLVRIAERHIELAHAARHQRRFGRRHVAVGEVAPARLHGADQFSRRGAR